METSQQKTKRLAKNTMLLYLRMFITMAISLYTSRIILENLGIDNYGIYNVVGGLVGMFAILTSTQNVAISRFLTFELGTGNNEKLSIIFSTSITIQIIMSAIILVIGESVGLWYVNNVMVIPPDRLVAANYCYQFSILTCIIGLFVVPFNALIIAHERMNVFAYMGLLGSLFVLAMAFLIAISPIDRLIFYGFLLMCSSVTVALINIIYCRKHFDETQFHFSIDKKTLKEMLSFSGWNYIGSSSGILREYGGNLLINFYFGPTVNAARALSSSVNNAITQFSGNFTTALKPQIIKSYAAGQKEYLFNLIHKGSKLSVFLMMFVSAPVLLNTSFVLHLWLKKVPDQTVLFTQLVLIYTMVEMISGPIITTMLATGKIKKYQIVVGGIQLLNIPISWLILFLGGIPQTVVLVSIGIAHCTLVARLVMMRDMIGLGIRNFIEEVYLRILLTAVVGMIIPFIVHLFLGNGWANFLITSTVCVFTMGLSILYVGCNSEERKYIYTSISGYIKKIFRK